MRAVWIRRSGCSRLTTCACVLCSALRWHRWPISWKRDPGFEVSPRGDDLSSVSSSPTLNFPSERVHLPPESHTPEHLTSTGLPLCSVCPRHRRIVTSTQLIFSPGYERLMGERAKGGVESAFGSAKGPVLFQSGSSHSCSRGTAEGL